MCVTNTILKYMKTTITKKKIVNTQPLVDRVLSTFYSNFHFWPTQATDRTAFFEIITVLITSTRFDVRPPPVQ